MKLTRIEVFNFRKLRRARLDLSDKQTLLVGANNSGKTSAMKALRKFLKDRGGIDTRDVTASNWAAIEQIAEAWTHEAEADLSPLLAQLPFLDVWLHADTSEFHHVAHLIPTLTWTGGLLGVRLRVEPKKGVDIKAQYLSDMDRLPTPKQVAFAEKLARIKRRAVPEECFRDKGLMSKWIDGNK